MNASRQSNCCISKQFSIIHVGKHRKYQRFRQIPSTCLSECRTVQRSWHRHASNRNVCSTIRRSGHFAGRRNSLSPRWSSPFLRSSSSMSSSSSPRASWSAIRTSSSDAVYYINRLQIKYYESKSSRIKYVMSYSTFCFKGSKRQAKHVWRRHMMFSNLLSP